jgi:DNA-binding MarR family transcriptional regulator
MSSDRILDLAEEFFRLARHRVPMEWLQTDLTMTQLKVLLTLYIDGPQTCGALASILRLSLPTMTGILARLDRRGYLQRRRDIEDGRRVICGLSTGGRGLVDRLWASGREELADLLADVPPEDLRSVERALEVLINALTSHPARLLPAQVSSHGDA